MATSSSSSAARCRRRVVLLRQPNCEVEYEPPMRYCYHRVVASRWTAWTDGNPGRRFYGYPYYYQVSKLNENVHVAESMMLKNLLEVPRRRVVLLPTLSCCHDDVKKST
ncbi:hypothetical protein QN277_007886 [Acacia crassicarpa]|uniref:Uncharacterized protein n=1 Tax=Acacia crassicarpa TaxID=499986 RepID=A0AAE1IQH7_9FABA|nr:hypothetical protein QN277_007886 [Acacia crassicarpa]